MPKIVDHDKRKKDIAEATWRVILEQGMEGATVRNIAKEADLSLGALRHYFSTQNELLVYAMELVKEQAEARINQIVLENLPPKAALLKILMELVPATPETMAETEVWFAFIAYARHKDAPFSAQDDGVWDGISRMVYSLYQANLLKDGLNPSLEAERLYALVDGLALHALLDPDRVDRERLIDVLSSQIDLILKEQDDQTSGGCKDEEEKS
ncbi:TetR/AcrR family transcriptional regulator [Pseudobacillus badius]|uniref:TetR/AcrR family transcriptional regulator n=1 Tax=Bacillus badius TaxID=1455 RepID=UPI0007B06FD9|nr:TetR family transcriptional regulator C-terminal domain-containing protein [Bacillus badius]KZN98505.1 TetR family transcriptional regulator [Bacillus badius]OCS83202.1 TetR family transcriptional regulator [Bacillus badius]OVE51578.1 TetR family transcriptional regulator [Bacillus badius]